MKRLVQGIILILAGFLLGVKFAEKILVKPLRRMREEVIKYQLLFQMMGKWVDLKQRGISIAEYFEEHDYKRVAIYGMGLAGQVLCKELTESGVYVAYAIDRNKNIFSGKTEVYLPEEKLPEVDVIVISAITYYEEILEILRKKVNCAIVSLEDTIYSIE